MKKFLKGKDSKIKAKVFQAIRNLNLPYSPRVLDRLYKIFEVRDNRRKNG